MAHRASQCLPGPQSIPQCLEEPQSLLALVPTQIPDPVPVRTDFSSGSSNRPRGPFGFRTGSCNRPKGVFHFKYGSCHRPRGFLVIFYIMWFKSHPADPKVIAATSCVSLVIALSSDFTLDIIVSVYSDATPPPYYAMDVTPPPSSSFPFGAFLILSLPPLATPLMSFLL